MLLLDLPAAIAMARRPFGWTQVKLSVTAGLPPSTVSDIERGHTDPAISVVAKLADTVDLKPSELLAMAEDAAEKRAELEARTETALDEIEASVARTEARVGPDR